MPSRWDYLLETKPVPILDQLLEEVSKLLAKDLAQWPPPVEELDLDVGGTFAPLFLERPPRPSAHVYGEALRLSHWELEREFEAYDDYMRNKRYLERGLAPTDRLALLFLNRWLVEQMLGLGEATESRIKRTHMRQILDKVEARLRLVQSPPSGLIL
ncbi:hypothetical protein [Hyalangium minutum]|uniref:Uncharacterized protein n=1 Tax=Hyalangium minutum TaxID=394096 RepID=A0A085W6W3_9BACT|nr:hypothetical protein [Hyalangium minutum]KFE63426.1 hypothetical protein DB31_2544 [Hyalangium minutum]